MLFVLRTRYYSLLTVESSWEKGVLNLRPISLVSSKDAAQPFIWGILWKRYNSHISVCIFMSTINVYLFWPSKKLPRTARWSKDKGVCCAGLMTCVWHRNPRKVKESRLTTKLSPHFHMHAMARESPIPSTSHTATGVTIHFKLLWIKVIKVSISNSKINLSTMNDKLQLQDTC